VHFEVFAVVDDDFLDDLVHVVGPVALGGYQVEQLSIGPVGRVGRRVRRGFLPIVVREQGEQEAYVGQALALVVVGEVRDARTLGVQSAPPRPSCVVSSPVTALTTSGPVMNIWAVPRTMKTKSVNAGA
jgi:hypothetical protein